MVPKPKLRPAVVIPDASPLIHLAAGGALTVLNGMGPVVIPDIVVLEVSFDRSRPYAAEIAAWIEAPGSNQPVEVVETEIGALYRLALEQGLPTPRNAGEIGIVTWLAENLVARQGPALVVYENGRVPNLLIREGVTATVAVATTRNLLSMAEEAGVIASAAALWSRIQQAVPTVNPASVLTVIEPEP